VTTEFLIFPENEKILQSLRSAGGASRERESLYGLIAERLAGRTYERTAFAFILMEVLYEWEEHEGRDLSNLLTRLVLALGQDQELAETTLDAYREIKDASPDHQDAISPELDELLKIKETVQSTLFSRAEVSTSAPAAGAPSAPSSTTKGKGAGVSAQETLQEAQKQLADRALAARVSIEMALHQTTQSRAAMALQDIIALRTAIRRFEELITTSEQQLLKNTGLIPGGPSSEPDPGRGDA
jgi:hypothetical protein